MIRESISGSSPTMIYLLYPPSLPSFNPPDAFPMSSVNFSNQYSKMKMTSHPPSAPKLSTNVHPNSLELLKTTPVPIFHSSSTWSMNKPDIVSISDASSQNQYHGHQLRNTSQPHPSIHLTKLNTDTNIHLNSLELIKTAPVPVFHPPPTRLLNQPDIVPKSDASYQNQYLMRQTLYPPPQGLAPKLNTGINSYPSEIIQDMDVFFPCGYKPPRRRVHRRPWNPCPKVPTPVLSKTSFNIGYDVHSSVEPGDLYGGLEKVWSDHFQYLFRLFAPHDWYFAPTEKDLSQMGWECFRDFGKVRFLCRNCKHGWTSMHGMVMFYYKFNPVTSYGHVRFLLMGQICSQCDYSNSTFETPMWYPEEANKVMTNLYYTISSEVYRYDTPPLITQRRHGKPRQQHIAAHCQGCIMGICKSASTVDRREVQSA